MKMTIRSKMIIMVFVITMFYGISSIVSNVYLHRVNTSYSDLIGQHTSLVASAKEMEVLTLTMQANARAYLLTYDSDYSATFKNANDKLQVLIEQKLRGDYDTGTLEKLAGMGKINSLIDARFKDLLKFVKDRQTHEANMTYYLGSLLPLGNELLPMVQSIVSGEQAFLDQSSANNALAVRQAMQTTAGLNILMLVSALLFGLYLSGRITTHLKKITEVMRGIRIGKDMKVPRIPTGSKDEIDDIAEAFNHMADALDLHNEQELRYRQTLQEQKWLEMSVAEFASMSQGVRDLHTLAQLFLTKLAPVVGASYGAFYISEGSGGSWERPLLRKYGSYADSGEEVGADGIRYGEGLVGQSALENRVIELNGLPEHYIRITSGIGSAAPNYVMILPAEYEGRVVAVLELASFGPFSDLKQQLLRRLMEGIGITISSIDGQMQVERLLEESQALTEELQAQSEELQLQQEELRSINEKLEEQYKNAENKSQELEQAKRELEEKALQLTVSSGYKSEFLANMSHELRTPLNSMLILSRMLADNTDGNLTPKQVEYADTVYTSGCDLLNLIHDILDLSKVEAGKMDIHSTEVFLADVCRYAERQFRPVAREKGLEFTIVTEPGLPESIMTDEQRLNQIMKNLLFNAFKFTQAGSVSLRVGKDEEEGWITVSVIDTGIGIAKDMQEMIFEAFRQADGTNSRKYGGTGLGLTISRRFTELLGGRIELSSEEGKGSTFTLYLPMNVSDGIGALPNEVLLYQGEAAVSQLSVLKQPPALGDDLLSGRKVLIVDDDMRNVFALTTALESQGMEVCFAENGQAGLEMLHEHPDMELVLMDIMMPHMDGYDAMRHIRSTAGCEGLPIIALTAKAMKSDRDKCMEAGASDYISKPIMLDKLFSLMKVWLYHD